MSNHSGKKQKVGGGEIYIYNHNCKMFIILILIGITGESTKFIINTFLHFKLLHCIKSIA